MAHALMPCGTRRTDAVLRSLLALLLELSLSRAQPRPFQSRRPAPTLSPQMQALILPSPHLPSGLLPHVRPESLKLKSAVLRSLQQFRRQRSLLNTSLSLSLHKNNSGTLRHLAILVARLRVRNNGSYKHVCLPPPTSAKQI